MLTLLKDVDLAKSFEKLNERMAEISRDESRYSSEKFASLKMAVQNHIVECTRGSIGNERDDIPSGLFQQTNNL